MKIQVLGSGCPTCKKLYELTKQAVEEANLKEKIEYLTGQEGIQKIIELGIMSSPVLAVNGKAIMIGFVDNVKKIKQLLEEVKNENFISA